MTVDDLMKAHRVSALACKVTFLSCRHTREAAEAAYELARGDQWLSDHAAEMREIEADMANTVREMEALTR